MERIPGHYECLSEHFGDISQLTNWILYSREMCHMTPEVSDLIPGLLAEIDKHIQVADRHHIKGKQKVKVQINLCVNNGDDFIATFHNVLWHQIYVK